jgi:hypothetical protein
MAEDSDTNPVGRPRLQPNMPMSITTPTGAIFFNIAGQPLDVFRTPLAPILAGLRLLASLHVVFKTQYVTEVKHEHTGYLTPPCQLDDQAYGLRWLQNDELRLALRRKSARQNAERESQFSLIAKRHPALHEELSS